jgi:hypothetical protein
MTHDLLPVPRTRGPAPLAQVRVWHLALLVAFVAIAIVNIQEQRQSDPALVALACAGFVGYWVLGWLGWRVVRRFEDRLGTMTLLILYLAAMAGLFLVATYTYLVIEMIYLRGHW